MSTLTPWVPLPETDDVRALVRALNQRLGRRELFWREAIQLPIRRAAANVSPAGADHTVLVDATAGSVGVTLPLAAQSQGLRYNVVKVDSSLNFVVVNRTGTDTISGATFRNITTQWAGVLLQADGTGTWVVLGDTFGPSGTIVAPGASVNDTLRFDGTNWVNTNSVTVQALGTVQISPGPLTVLCTGTAQGTFGNNGGTFEQAVQVTRPAGQPTSVRFQTNGIARWDVRVENDAETGSDAGSSFKVRARTDAGAFIDDPLQITRAAAGPVSFSRSRLDIRGVPYTWPAASAVGVLTNNGSGTLSWAPAGGLTTGTATLDFGAFPGNSDTSVAVTGQAGIVAGSIVNAWLRPTATADHTADEHVVESLRVLAGNIVAGTGFTIYGINTSEIGEPLTPLARTPGPGSEVAIPSAPDERQRIWAGGKGTRLYGQWSVAWAWS